MGGGAIVIKICGNLATEGSRTADKVFHLSDIMFMPVRRKMGQVFGYLMRKESFYFGFSMLKIWFWERNELTFSIMKNAF